MNCKNEVDFYTNSQIGHQESRLLCERGAGSGERGAGSEEQGAGILRVGSRNYCQSFLNIEIPLKIEILMAIFSKNSISGENWDLLPWMQKTLQPSSIDDTQ
jgi:hypothetical protein